jgi:hypothetical protein
MRYSCELGRRCRRRWNPCTRCSATPRSGRTHADGSTSADVAASGCLLQARAGWPATSIGPRMAGASAVGLPRGDLLCTEDAGKAEPAQLNPAERPKKHLSDISNPSRCEGCTGLREPPCRALILVRDVVRDHDHDGRRARWGHTRPQTCALAAVRVHQTSGQ